MGSAVLDEVDELFGGTATQRQAPRNGAEREATASSYGGRPGQRPVQSAAGAAVLPERAGAPWEESKPTGVVQPMRRPVGGGSDGVRAAGPQPVVTRPMEVQTEARADNGAATPRGAGTVRPVDGAQRGAAEGPTAAGDERTESSSGGRDYFSVHCYGGKAALCFSADTTKGDDAPTVRIEAAPSTGPRAYAWGQKIAVQCTLKELPIVLAAILGWMPSVRFAAHGADNKKGFSFQHQEGGKLFAKVWDGRGARMVPIPASDLFAIADLFVRQMLKGRPYMTHDGLLTMVRQLARCYAEAGLGEQERSPGG